MYRNTDTYTFFFFQAEDGIRDHCVTGVQTCALPICCRTLGLRRGCCQQGGQLFGWRPALQRHRKTLVVVSGFPAPGRDGRFIKIGESLAPPELLLVDPVASFHLAVLLGPPGLDVAVPDPQRLNGEGKGEGELVAVVALYLPDPEGKRPAQLCPE